MKSLFSMACLLVLFVMNSSATIKTLNNRNPSPGQYTTWAQVEASLAPGDTIYVSGSSLSYGNITMTPTSSMDFTIIGAGFQPNKQQPFASMFDEITSYHSLSASLNIQIKLIGLTINKLELNHLDKLYLSKCYIKRSTYIGIHYWASAVSIVEFNIFSTKGNVAPNQSQTSFFTNASLIMKPQVRNNIFMNQDSTYIDSHYIGITNVDFKNNLFNKGILYAMFSESSVLNNIFIGATVQMPSTQNYFYFNSLDSASTTNLDHGNNLFNTNALFVNAPMPFPLAEDFTKDYHLQTGSPCIGSGAWNEDMGVYGGVYGSGFTMTGEPNIPQIKQMNLPATVIKGQNFNVDLISTNK
jgi:hypothetical protein